MKAVLSKSLNKVCCCVSKFYSCSCCVTLAPGPWPHALPAWCSHVMQGYRRCILTPNIAELGRLAGAVGVATEGRMGSQWQAHARDIAAGGWTCVG